MPLGVVLPKSDDDVVATLKLCAEHGVPIIPAAEAAACAARPLEVA